MQPDEAAPDSLEQAGTLSTPFPERLGELPVLPPGARLGPYSIQAVRGRALEVSETAFPKTLLEAKMAKLGGRKARA